MSSDNDLASYASLQIKGGSLWAIQQFGFGREFCISSDPFELQNGSARQHRSRLPGERTAPSRGCGRSNEDLDATFSSQFSIADDHVVGQFVVIQRQPQLSGLTRHDHPCRDDWEAV
jgi:hypothetical protein